MNYLYANERTEIKLLLHLPDYNNIDMHKCTELTSSDQIIKKYACKSMRYR